MFLSLIALASAATAQRPISTPERSVIERYVKKYLSDPYTARFTASPVPNAKTELYCGVVNSKGPEGGYTGPANFVVRVERDGNGRIVSANSLTISDGGDMLRNYNIKEVCKAEGYSI